MKNEDKCDENMPQQCKSPSQLSQKQCQKIAADTPDDIKQERLVGSLLVDQNQVQSMRERQHQEMYKCRKHPINQLRKAQKPENEKKHLLKAISLVINQAKRKEILNILQSQGIPRKIAILKVQAFSLSGERQLIESELDIEDIKETFEDFANVKNAQYINGVGIFQFQDIVQAFLVQFAFDNQVNDKQDFKLSVKWYQLQDDQDLFSLQSREQQKQQQLEQQHLNQLPLADKASIQLSLQQLTLSDSVNQVQKLAGQQINSITNIDFEKSQNEQLNSDNLNLSSQICLENISRRSSQSSIGQNSMIQPQVQSSSRKDSFSNMFQQSKKTAAQEISSSSSSFEEYKDFTIHSNCQTRYSLKFKQSKSANLIIQQQCDAGAKFDNQLISQTDMSSFSQHHDKFQMQKTNQQQNQPQLRLQYRSQYKNESNDYSFAGNNNSSSHIANGCGGGGVGVSSKYTGRFQIQIENDKEFQVARRLIGSKGSNMKRIIQACKKGFPPNAYSNDVVKLRLRGKGSGFKQGPMKKESDEPLHLCISSKYSDKYKIAAKLVEDLLIKIYRDYKSYCLQRGKKAINLTIKKNQSQANLVRKSNPANILPSNMQNQYNFPSRQRNKQPFGYNEYQQPQNLGHQFDTQSPLFQHTNSFDYSGKLPLSHSAIVPTSHSFNSNQHDQNSSENHYKIPQSNYHDNRSLYQPTSNTSYHQNNQDKPDQIFNFTPYPQNMAIIPPSNFASVYAATEPGAPLIRHYLVPQNYPFINVQPSTGWSQFNQSQTQLYNKNSNNNNNPNHTPAQSSNNHFQENDRSKFQTMLSPNAGSFIPQSLNYHHSSNNNSSNSHINQKQARQFISLMHQQSSIIRSNQNINQ